MKKGDSPKLAESNEARDYKNRIELRHLRYFIAVAEERSFSRAAQRLRIAQPPLSQQIIQLESWLQATLFNRTSHGIDLTPAGKVFLEQARLTLDRMDRSISLAREAQNGARGEFRLGVTYSALFLLIPDILRKVARKIPDVTVALTEMSVADQITELKNGRIDAGILRAPISDENIETRVLLEEPLVAAIPFDHRLTKKKTVSLADISGEMHLWPDLSFKRQAHQMLRKNQIPIGSVYEAPEINILIGLVGAGYGVAIVPQSIQNLKFANVEFRRIRERVPKFSLALAWEKTNNSPMLLKFIELIEAGYPKAKED